MNSHVIRFRFKYSTSTPDVSSDIAPHAVGARSHWFLAHEPIVQYIYTVSQKASKIIFDITTPNVHQI